ncbi:MAG: putative ABC transport system permease protein [Planctomycetota bacterium]|jgi:putative ABC transport system permease protein
MSSLRRGTFIRAFRLGVKSLLLHKLRSLLTTLGVLFGVASVIAMLAVGEGASIEAQAQITELGSQNVILRSIKPPEDAVSNSESRVIAYGLTEKDRARVADTYPGVNRVVPVLNVPEEVRVGPHLCRPLIRAVPPRYQSVTGRVVMDGRFINYRDEEQVDPVAVLGYDVARYLFPFSTAIGEKIKLGADYFVVVGVLLPRGPISSAGAGIGSEVGGEVFIPHSIGLSWYGGRQTKRRSGSTETTEVELHEIIVEVERAVDVPFVAAACRTMLDQFHAQKDYKVVVPLELLMRARETKRIFNIVLGAIAGISLLVGGIGIMNVMLATVTERTREIGIRRALGAKRKHIVTQFLVETVVLSAGGGLAGVGLGLLIPAMVERFADLPTVVTPEAPLLAFSISVATGVIFGLYPAWRAANMDPVEALRHE